MTLAASHAGRSYTNWGTAITVGQAGNQGGTFANAGDCCIVVIEAYTGGSAMALTWPAGWNVLGTLPYNGSAVCAWKVLSAADTTNGVNVTGPQMARWTSAWASYSGGAPKVDAVSAFANPGTGGAVPAGSVTISNSTDWLVGVAIGAGGSGAPFFGGSPAMPTRVSYQGATNYEWAMVADSNATVPAGTLSPNVTAPGGLMFSGVIAITDVSAPAAPSLLAPANNSTLNLASGFNVTAGFNSTDNQAMQAFAARVKAQGSSTYSYLNGGLLQSTIFWNPDSVAVGGQFSTYFPGSPPVTNQTGVNWSAATQGISGLTGPFAADWSVIGQGPPSVTVTGPGGTVAVSQPTVTWTTTPGTGASQTAYRVVIYSSAQIATPGFTPGTTVGVWDSSVVAGSANSAQVGVVLVNHTTYSAYVQVTQTGGQLSNWSYSSFTLGASPPAPPVISGVPSTDPITGCPFIQLSAQGYDNLISFSDASFEAGLGSWTYGNQPGPMNGIDSGGNGAGAIAFQTGVVAEAGWQSQFGTSVASFAGLGALYGPAGVGWQNAMVSGAFTAECLFYISPACAAAPFPGNMFIIARGEQHAFTEQWFIGAQQGTNKLLAMWQTNDGVQHYILSTVVLGAGWHYCQLTWNGSTVTFTVDGTAATGAYSNVIAGTSAYGLMILGGNQVAGNGVDEVRISNVVRSYAVPSSEWPADANTMCLYHLDGGLNLSNAQASDGAWALSLVPPNQGGNLSMTTSTTGYAVNPDFWYTVQARFQAIANARACTLTVNWFTSTGTLIASTSAPTVTSGTWVRAAANVLSPANAAYATLTISVAGTTGYADQTYVDSVGLQPATGVGYGNMMLTLNPYAWWRLADAPGSSTVLDDGSHALTGTVVGTVNFGSYTGPDGANPCASLPAATGNTNCISAPLPTGPWAAFTAVIWAYGNLTAPASQQQFFVALGGGAGSDGFCIFSESDGSLWANLQVTGTTYTARIVTPQASSAWNMLVVTWDGQTLTMWLFNNNVPLGQSATAAFGGTMSLSAGTFYIGGPAGFGAWPKNQEIVAQASVWQNVALSSLQLANLYNSMFGAQTITPWARGGLVGGTGVSIMRSDGVYVRFASDVNPLSFPGQINLADSGPNKMTLTNLGGLVVVPSLAGYAFGQAAGAQITALAYLQGPQGAGAAYGSIMGPWCFECFYTMGANTGNYQIVAGRYGQNVNTQIEWQIFIEGPAGSTPGRLNLSITDGSGTIRGLASTGSVVTPGKCVHIAAQWDGANISLWCNGARVATAAMANVQPPYAGNSLMLLQQGPSGIAANYWTSAGSQIDEVRVSNGTRYQATPYTPPSQPFNPDPYTALLYHLDAHAAAQQAVVNDYEIVPGETYSYTGTVESLGYGVQSAGQTTPSFSVTTTKWYQLAPAATPPVGTATPTSNTTIVAAQPIDWKPVNTEQSTAHPVAGAQTMNVISNVMMHQDFTGTFEMFDHATYHGFNKLLTGQQIVFISSPFGALDSGYFRVGPASGGSSGGSGSTAKTTSLQASTIAGPHRTVDVTAVAQPRPTP